MNFINTVKNTIKEHDLIQFGDRVVVGVSGGADSVALLKALHALKSEYNLTIVVCHVNHKVRPGAAERDQKFVEDLCESLGVECYVKEAFVEQLAIDWKMSTEEAGRKVRYDFFEEVANGSKIATAHNQNDNAETVLMRIMRGTGLNGLTGIPYKRDNIIRPILDVSRNMIEEYLKEHNQPYMTDETNLETIYTRNKIRLNLIPEIMHEFNPNFIQTLNNNIKNYRDDNDCIDSLVREFYNNYCTFAKNVFAKVDVYKLMAQHKAIQKRVVMKMANNVVGKDISSTLVVSITNIINKEVGTIVQISDEYVARRCYNHLIIEKLTNESQNLTKIPVTLNSVITVGNMKIKVSETTEKTPIVNNGHVFYLPRTMFSDAMCFRTRHTGDILHVAENVSKKVNRYFTDAKVAENNRNNYWLLTDGLWTAYWIPSLFGGRFQNRTGSFVKFEIL